MPPEATGRLTKALADVWAGAPASEPATAFRLTLALDDIQTALFHTWAVLVLGLPFVRLGERTVRCAAGAFVHVPPGVVHGFHNPGPDLAGLLILLHPAAGLGLIEGMYGLPAVGAPDAAAIGDLFAQHQSELISSEGESDQP